MKQKAFLLLGVLLLSTSCIDLDGRMNVTDSLDVKVKSGFLNMKKKTTTIRPGNYRAELKLKSEKNANLKISGNGMEEITIPLKSDYKLNIPTNGRFEIRGYEVEQPINIQGDIRTFVSEYGHASGPESCTYSYRTTRCERVCREVPTGGPGGHGGPGRNDRPSGPRGPGGPGHGGRPSPSVIRCDNVCRDIVTSRTGYRHVSYHYKKVDRKINLEFMREDSTYIAATMSADSSDTTRIVTSETLCR